MALRGHRCRYGSDAAVSNQRLRMRAQRCRIVLQASSIIHSVQCSVSPSTRRWPERSLPVNGRVGPNHKYQYRSGRLELLSVRMMLLMLCYCCRLLCRPEVRQQLSLDALRHASFVSSCGRLPFLLRFAQARGVALACSIRILPFHQQLRVPRQ